MLQDMDHSEASCDFHVEVRTLDQLEQREICDLSVISFGRVPLTVRRDFILSVSLV